MSLCDGTRPKRQWCHLEVANSSRMKQATEKEPNTRPKKGDESRGSVSGGE